MQTANNDGGCKPASINESGLSIRQDEDRAVVSTSSASAFHITSKEQNTVWYRGVFGLIAIREKRISTRRLGSRIDGKPVSTQKILTVTTPFLRRAVELYFGASLVSLPRALRVYQLVDMDAPIWDMCRKGDLDGIQDGFANGSFFPFVVDNLGWTLLHVISPDVSPCAY